VDGTCEEATPPQRELLTANEAKPISECNVEPFALDATFDYEHVRLSGQRFCMKLAQEKGEFYDIEP